MLVFCKEDALAGAEMKCPGYIKRVLRFNTVVDIDVFAFL